MMKKKASHKNGKIRFSHFKLRRNNPVSAFLRRCVPAVSKDRPGSLLPDAGSLTAEAAMAVPLFFLCVVSLICMMDMYGMTAAQTAALAGRAERLAVEAGLTGEEALDVIDLYEPFTYTVRWFPVPGASVRIPIRGRVRVWNGRRGGDNSQGETGREAEELVYMTDYGSVYHTSSACTHLHLSVQAVSGSRVSSCRNKNGARYHACEKCAGAGGRAGTVYITDDGDCWHNSAECGGLTRNVKLVRRSEAAGVCQCSRCAALAGSSP